MRGIGRYIIAGILTVALGGTSQATTGSLARQIYQSFVDGDYPRAASLIERQLERTPRDPALLYNAACAYSHLAMLDRAASYLRRAVEAGLNDVDQILTDPDLDPIRNHPTYTVLIERLRSLGYLE